MESKGTRISMAVLSSVAVLVGITEGPLLIRYYSQNGGSKKWLSTFVQKAGFPVTLPLVWYLYKQDSSSVNHINARFFLWSTVLGVLVRILNLLYSYDLSYLPVSTAQVLLSTILGFTAIFAHILARQKMTLFALNGLVLLTVSSVSLACIGRTHDIPHAVTLSEYSVGFALVQRSKMTHVTLALVLEMQLVMSAWATLFSLGGLLASKEILGLKKAAQEFRGHGVGGYVIVNVSCAVFLTISLMGICGVTLCGRACCWPPLYPWRRCSVCW